MGATVPKFHDTGMSSSADHIPRGAAVDAAAPTSTNGNKNNTSLAASATKVASAAQLPSTSSAEGANNTPDFLASAKNLLLEDRSPRSTAAANHGFNSAAGTQGAAEAKSSTSAAVSAAISATDSSQPAAFADQSSQTVSEKSPLHCPTTAEILREIETMRAENAALQSKVAHYAMYVNSLAQQMQMMQAAAWHQHQQQQQKQNQRQLLRQQQPPPPPPRRRPEQQQQQQQQPYRQQHHHYSSHHEAASSSTSASSPLTPKSSAWSSLPKAEDGRPSLELALAMANIEDETNVDKPSKDEVCLMKMEARLDAEAGWDSKNDDTFGNMSDSDSDSDDDEPILTSLKVKDKRIEDATADFQRQRKANYGRSPGAAGGYFDDDDDGAAHRGYGGYYKGGKGRERSSYHSKGYGKGSYAKGYGKGYSKSSEKGSSGGRAAAPDSKGKGQRRRGKGGKA